MSGGALLTHNSTCLPGWTPAPGGTTASFGASKCYKVFSRSFSWREAQRACASAVSRQEVSESIKQAGCAVVVNPASGGVTGGRIYSRALLLRVVLEGRLFFIWGNDIVQTFRSLCDAMCTVSAPSRAPQNARPRCHVEEKPYT